MTPTKPIFKLRLPSPFYPTNPATLTPNPASMKTLSRTRTTTILSLSAILVTGAMICFYGAIAKGPLGGAQKASSISIAPATPRPSGMESEGDPQKDAIRREFFDRIFLTGRWSLPPETYAAAMAATREMPQMSRSALLGGGASAPDVQHLHWQATVPPPIINSYGGNGSARIFVLGLDPTNSNVVYTGGFGGMAKTADGGQTWQYLSDNWDSQSVTTISVDPNAPSNVYAGTGSPYLPYCVGLYRSFDGGTNWTRLSSPFTGTAIRKVMVDPNASGTTGNTTLYLASGSSTLSGLWKSVNSGQDWTQLVASSSNGIWDIAIDPTTNPSTIYYADGNGVFKGQGSSFTQINYSNQNWTNGSLRLSVVNSVPYLLAPSRTGVRRLYRYQSATVWTEIPTLCPAVGECRPPGNNGIIQIAPSVFAVDPFDPTVILIGTNTLYRTANAGATWADIGGVSQIHPDQTALAFSPATSGVVYSGNDGGMSRSTAHGQTQTWANLNQNLPGSILYRAALSQDGSMVAGTQDHGAVYSFQGTQWDMSMSGGGDSGAVLIDPIDSDTAYWTTFYHENFQRYKRSTHTNVSIHPPQFGVPFTPSSEPCNFFPTFSMNLSHPTRLIAACQHLVRTDDGTAPTVQWTSIGAAPFVDVPLGHFVSAANEAPSDSNVIFAIENYGLVWRTTNANLGANATWQAIYNPGGISNVVVDPTNPQIAYLACDSGVHKTTNQGASWTPYGTPGYIYRDLVVDPANPNNLFVGSNKGVFASADGGVTWLPLGVDLPAGLQVWSLSFNPASRQLAAATFGRGVYTLNLDNVAPTVSMTAPEDGSYVSGIVTVSATASDNHRIAGVQFRLDGANLGPEDTTEPYSISWDTSSSPGSHALTAVARDPASNVATSNEVSVKVLK